MTDSCQSERLTRATDTYREIMDQPRSWRVALAAAREQWPAIRGRLGAVLAADEILLTGCGSSYYLSLVAAALLRPALKRRVTVLPSSELLLHAGAALGPLRPGLLVALSRSGETSETVLAAERAKGAYGVPVLSITCRGESSLGRLGDATLAMDAVQEAGVVMTKSFTSILIALQQGAGCLAGETLDDELGQLPGILERLLLQYAGLAEQVGALSGVEKRVFLGGGPFYGLACEANLKMKEMAIVSSEVYHSLEFRHGPISIVDRSTLVTCFVSDAGRDYEVPLLAELKSLGARLFVVCERAESAIEATADHLIELRSGLGEAARVALHLPFAHLLAHACAVSRGEDPDHPRNLSPVVMLS